MVKLIDTIRYNRRGILNWALAPMLDNSMFQGALDQLGLDSATDDKKPTVNSMEGLSLS